MTPKTNTNGNGRRAFFTKDTFVPWGAALACASLAWWAASKYGDLERSIQATASNVAERISEQRRETSLEMQALKFAVDYQGQRIERIEKAVEALGKDAK